MDDPKEENGIPIPRGSYNFNFDEFDENVNPFQSKSKVSNSPTKNDVDPFASKSKLGHSPTENNNVISNSIQDSEVECVDRKPQNHGMKKPKSQEFSTNGDKENSTASSSAGSPDKMDTAETSPEAPDKMDTAETSPEAEAVDVVPKTKKSVK